MNRVIKYTGGILKAIFVASILLTIGMLWYYMLYEVCFFDGERDVISCSECDNIGLIRLHGKIVTYDYYYGYQDGISDDIVSSDQIVRFIENANKRDHIKGLIIEIDSGGGLPVASEEIMSALKRSTKPTIAVIRDTGVSGAYLAASGADRIYASEMSDVGGIGVTMSYLDHSKKHDEEGITYQQISSGKFKDAGSQDKELTDEERELLMRDVIETHRIFMRIVAENRGLDTEEVEKIADGSSMLGQRAKELGLIDEIGDVYSARKWMAEELGIEPSICVYKTR